MSLFDRFRGRPSPPPPSPTPNAAKLTVHLHAPPPFQPLPVRPTSALDARISTDWLRFQQSHVGATWAQFQAELHAENERLAAEIARITEELRHYR